MSLGVEGLCGLYDGLVCGYGEIDEPVEAFVDDALFERTVFESLVDVVGTVAAGGHFELVAALNALYPVVAAGPVGYHNAVETPFIAQDLFEQMMVFVSVCAVELVIGGHYRLGAALLDGDFEGS